MALQIYIRCWILQMFYSPPTSGAQIQYVTTLIMLGALLYDVSNKKYLEPGQNTHTLTRNALLKRKASLLFKDRVQDLILHISFSIFFFKKKTFEN